MIDGAHESSERVHRADAAAMTVGAGDDGRGLGDRARSDQAESRAQSLLAA